MHYWKKTGKKTSSWQLQTIIFNLRGPNLESGSSLCLFTFPPVSLLFCGGFSLSFASPASPIFLANFVPRIHRVQCVSPLGRVSDRAIARLAAAQQLVSFGVAKALLVLLRILVDPQHIPTELPGPLSADFGPSPHKSVSHQKIFYQLAPPPRREATIRQGSNGSPKPLPYCYPTRNVHRPSFSRTSSTICPTLPSPSGCCCPGHRTKTMDGYDVDVHGWLLTIVKMAVPIPLSDNPPLQAGG